MWYLTGDRDPANVPLLATVYRIEARKPYLHMLAANALVHAGRLEYVCELAAYLGDKGHEYQDGVPSMLLEAATEHPHEVALCLAHGLLDERRRGREVSAWTAGAAGLAETAPVLRDALLDPEWRVRAAAAWALGRIGAAAARGDLEELSHDREARVRAFAADALARLDRRAR
jgi:HEAT repeat protein